MKSRTARWSLGFLAGLYLAVWLAPFLSPYSPTRQFRESYLQPPSPIGLADQRGRWQLRPHIQVLKRVSDTPDYQETEARLPVIFLVEGEPYEWMGMECRTRLFGLQDPDHQVFLLGSDELGRDLFSRILYGAQFSLTIGLVGIATTLAVGVFVGALSGYCSGWIDGLAMRVADLFLSLPALFVILGVRAVSPGRLSVGDLYWLMVLIFTLMGWGSVARVVRGQVAGLREREHVLAALALGIPHWKILTRHILPFTSNYLVVQASVLVPAYILGEVTLSFLGVGVQEPHPSWGTLLTAAASLNHLTHHPWLLFPALAIFLVVLAFNFIGDGLKATERKRILLT